MDVACINYQNNVANDNYSRLKLTSQLHEVLITIGIPPNIHGYRYILYSIELIVSDPEYMYAVTKGLYVDVAKKFRTKPSNVERDIRFAIARAWRYGNREYLNSIFKNCVQTSKVTSSNSVFLARIYYYLVD